MLVSARELCGFTSQAFSVNCSGEMRPEAAPLAYVRRWTLHEQQVQMDW